MVMEGMASVPILSVKQSVSIDTMINFDADGAEHGDGPCKQALIFCNNRSIGVSNFAIQHLEGLKKEGLPIPSVNQIELHPWMRRQELVDYCRKEGIVIMGYSPLAKAFNMTDERLNEKAKK